MHTLTSTPTSAWPKPFDIHARSATLLAAAGFVDVRAHRYIWPVGGWHADPTLRRLGLMNQVRLLENVEAYGLRILTQAGRWPVERAQVFLAEMRRAVREPEARAWQEV